MKTSCEKVLKNFVFNSTAGQLAVELQKAKAIVTALPRAIEKHSFRKTFQKLMPRILIN